MGFGFKEARDGLFLPEGYKSHNPFGFPYQFFAQRSGDENRYRIIECREWCESQFGPSDEQGLWHHQYHIFSFRCAYYAMEFKLRWA